MTLIEPQPQRQSQQYRYFLDSLASEATRRTYSLNLRQYCRHLNVDDCIKLLGSQPSLIEAQVIDYLGDLKKKGLSYSRLNSMLSAILHDVSLNRKKIARFMGEKSRGLRSEQGHAYTREQIAEILSVCDERTKAIILLLTSTGMRIGAIPSLKFKHLKIMDLSSDFDSKTEAEGEAKAETRRGGRSGIHLYLIAVYGGEYFTFCTPEAAKIIDSYLDYRTRSGEIIGSESPLIREQFNREDGLKIRHPKHVNLGNLSSLLIDVTNKAGIRQHEIQTEGSIHGQHRKPVPLAHGFRRFFNTALMNADVLLYQRAIEGIGLTLENAWLKFNDPQVPEKQKVSYLRLTKECHSAMIELIANGPTVMAIQDITRRADALGITDTYINNNNNNNSHESSDLSS